MAFKFISTGQCYSHSHYHRRSDGRTVCDMRRARWGKVVNGGLVGRTTCFREQLPRCVWEAEGGADARASTENGIAQYRYSQVSPNTGIVRTLVSLTV